MHDVGTGDHVQIQTGGGGGGGGEQGVLTPTEKSQKYRVS